MDPRRRGARAASCRRLSHAWTNEFRIRGHLGGDDDGTRSIDQGVESVAEAAYGSASARRRCLLLDQGRASARAPRPPQPPGHHLERPDRGRLPRPESQAQATSRGNPNPPLQEGSMKPLREGGGGIRCTALTLDTPGRLR